MRLGQYFLMGSLLAHIFCCSSTHKITHTSNKHPIQYDWSQIDSLQENEKRLIAVFLHTSWCQFCKNMENTTFKNPEVIQLLNDQFYFIAFDAEKKAPISIKGQTFQYQQTGKNTGSHELAMTIAAIDGQLVFPTVVLLNPAYEIIFQHSGYLDKLAMQAILEQSLDP